MTQTDKRRLEQLIHSARIIVREIGCAAQKMERETSRSLAFARIADEATLPYCPDPPVGEPWTLGHQVMHAYDMACAHLTQLDPASAAEFIRSTYGPSFRNTGVAR